MAVKEIPNKKELEQFTGTEVWYKYLNLMLTEGAKYVADRCAAWWLIDAIAGYQALDKISKEHFQVYKLEVYEVEGCEGRPEKKAKLTVTDGNYKPLHSQDIEYTDFPWDDITLWCIDKTVLLPSEY